MYSLRHVFGGGRVDKSTLFLWSIAWRVPPHFCVSIAQRSSLISTTLTVFCLYILQVNSSNWRKSSSETAQDCPTAEKTSCKRGVFLRSLMGFTLPMPLKVLVVSHLVNMCRASSASQYDGVKSHANLEISSSLLLFPEPVSKRIVMFKFGCHVTGTPYAKSNPISVAG